MGAKFQVMLVFCLLAVLTATTALTAAPPTPIADPNLSFRQEVHRAIDRGLDSLLVLQSSNGWWSTPDHPALTALALTALAGHPADRYRTNAAAALKRGYDYLLASVQEDGSIHRGSLVNYNTAICLMALVATGDPAYSPVILRAREYLARSQVDLNEPGKIDSPFDGGVGYGSKFSHSDLNNTLTALEALYHSQAIAKDQNAPTTRELNWAGVLHFIQSCQNLSNRNHQAWVSTDPRDQGGFVYYPGHSMAGGVTNAATSKVSLRSYGSISYAGLLSYIYARLKKDDPRVAAAYDWLRRNYSLAENPGMGQQGFYYYLHLMAKALNAYGGDRLQIENGTMIDWRKELAQRLLDLQQRDGSWMNDNGRWWERDPSLVTAYAVLSLEIIERGL